MHPNNEILDLTYKLALKAFHKDEVPVGAVVYNSKTFEIVSTGYNLTESKKNALLHAEIVAIQKALKKLNTKRLDGYSIFVSLEPCVMCAGAISIARLDNVFFGAFDKKTGGVMQGCKVFEQAQTHHKPNFIGGFDEKRFGQLLTDFFKLKRKK